MAKHSSPPVELADVSKALPVLPYPMHVQVTLYQVPGRPDRLQGAVELVYHSKSGGVYVYKRWSPPGAPVSTQAMVNGLLLAAMDCNLFVSKADPAELRKAIEWGLATL